MIIANIALSVQIAGTSILFLLFVFLSIHDKRRYLRYWTMSWFLYAVGLAALLFSFLQHARWPYVPYQILELSSMAMLTAAGLNYSRGIRLRKRDLLLWIPMFVWSVVTTVTLRDFNPIYVQHSLLMALFFAYNAYILFTSPWFHHNVGNRILAYICLVIGMMDFHYFFAFGYFSHRHPGSLEYLQFSNFYDLLLQFVMAIGMVITAMQETHRQLEGTNAQLHEAQDRLRYLAQTDSLTGVFNRHAFREICDRELSLAQASKCHDALGLLDIDNLKKINDLAGHSVGDEVLKRVAKAITSMVRGEDCLVRWGGDEFLLLMRDTEIPQAEKRLELLKEHLSHQSVSSRAGKIFFGISYGVVELRSVDELDAAIEEADRRLYVQKQSSRQSLIVV